VSPEGTVYVTDSGNARISAFICDCVTGADAVASQPRFLLPAPRPNPWAGSTTLGFELAKAERAALTIYDVQGRTLKRWSWASLPSGPHQLAWNGLMDNGRLAPSGILFYRLEANGRILTQKMVRLR
jgi:hypothetical protein